MYSMIHANTIVFLFSFLFFSCFACLVLPGEFIKHTALHAEALSFASFKLTFPLDSTATKYCGGNVHASFWKPIIVLCRFLPWI